MSAPDALSPDANVVVLAAAGTGKTWLLTSRILRLLIEGAEPGGILALTFTRKAAGEIRERVFARARALALATEPERTALLTALGTAPDGPGRLISCRLYEALLKSRHALRISTFHGFCQELLQRFPLEAGVSPGFELRELSAADLKRAWRALLAHSLQDPTGNLATALRTLNGYVGSAGQTYEALLEFWAHRQDWWAYTETDREPVVRAAEALTQILGVTAPDPLPDALASELAALAGHLAPWLPALTARIRAGLASPYWRDILCPTFTSDSGGVRRFPLKKADCADIDGIEALRRSWSHAGGLIAAEDGTRRRQHTARLSQAWFCAGAAFVDRCLALQAERRALDFADLEWRAYLLLRQGGHADWVQYKLDQRVDHILIDEFQDTSPTQWQLLQPLIEELVAGDPGRRRSLFIVGDEKQSLYGFRRADSRLFTEVAEWARKNASARVFTEDRSRRSSPAIMDFVNLVFAPTDEHRPLPSFRTHSSAREALWGRVELLPLLSDEESDDDPPDWRNPLQTPRPERIAQRYVGEAQTLVEKIHSLVGSLVVGAGESARLLQYRDVMILVRDRTHAATYEEALRHAGLPFTGTGNERLADLPEVKDLIDLLAVLMDPTDDRALAAILRSPLFGFTDDDLAALAHAARSQQEPWWQALQAVPHDRAQGAVAQLARWRGLVDAIPVHDLLHAVLAETDAVARYQQASPAQIRPRIGPAFRAVLHLSLDLDGGRYPGLGRFRDHLVGYEGGLAGAGEEHDGIRLMTIHGAKGLEAPVVFLVDTARPRAADAGLRAVTHWPPLAPRPEQFYVVGNKDTIDEHSGLLLQQQALRQGQEDMNALYVALTRAAQMLIISGCAPRRAGNLGWYGLITERIQHAGIRREAVPGTSMTPWVIFEHGRQPPVAAAPEKPGVASPPPTPPRVLTVSAGIRLNSISPSEGGPNAPASRQARARGAALHRLLQLATEGTLERALVRVRAEFPLLPQHALEQCRSAVVRVLADPALRPWFDGSAHLWARNEVPVMYQREGSVVHGIMDRVVLNHDGLTILDYKTHEDVSPETALACARGYREQMWLYEEGARRLWPGHPCRSVILFTHLALAVPLGTSRENC